MSTPEGDSLRVQLTELNNRSRTYSARLWQLPMAYLGAGGVALVQLSASALPVGLLVTGIAGLLFGWHLIGIEDGRNRATKALIDLERQLHLPPAARNRPSYTWPLLGVTFAAAIGSLVAAFVLYGAQAATPAPPLPARAMSLGPVQLSLAIGLDGVVNVLVTAVLVGVTWYYARNANASAQRANTIAAAAETARETESRKIAGEQRELAEARIGVVAYALLRQLSSWVREATPGLVHLDKVYEYVLGAGSDVKHEMGVEAMKMIGTQTALAQVGQWLHEHSGESLDRAEARVYQLAVEAPRARDTIRTAIYDVTVLFYEGTRRLTEQELGVRRGGGFDPVEAVLAFRQIRQCAALLPGAIADELRAAAERLSRS